MLGKILRWLSLTLFTFSLGLTLFFYNISTVTTEKNIKMLAEKVVQEFLFQNKKLIDENYDSLIETARLAPEEKIEFPTGLEELNISLEASEIAQFSREEFYDKIPVLVADEIYDKSLDIFINDHVEQNPALPGPAKAIISNFKSEGGDSLFYNSFLVSALLAVLFLVSFLIFQNARRFFFEVGAVFLLVSLPPFAILYFSLPLANNVIRQTDFATIASLIMDMTEQIQKNYLYSILAGFVFFAVGFLVCSEINVRKLFRKKSEYERVIKT